MSASAVFIFSFQPLLLLSSSSSSPFIAISLPVHQMPSDFPTYPSHLTPTPQHFLLSWNNPLPHFYSAWMKGGTERQKGARIRQTLWLNVFSTIQFNGLQKPSKKVDTWRFRMASATVQYSATLCWVKQHRALKSLCVIKSSALKRSEKLNK